MIRNFLICALISLSFFDIYSVAHADTSVSGILTGDTTWTLAESPYVVTDNLTVPAGVTLTLEPGVVVKPSREMGIFVEGNILAEGTEAAQIFFTSHGDDTVGGDTNGDADSSFPLARDWRHIEMRPGSTGAFRHVTVRYGGAFDDLVPMTGIKNDGGTITLDHVTLTNNGYDGYSQTEGSSVLSHVHISRHDVGITLYGGVTTIENSIIEENGTGLGVYAWGQNPVVTVSSSTITNNQYGMDLGAPDITVTGSRIVGNHIAEIYGSALTPPDVRNNWWGDASGPLHENNPLGTGGQIFGDALFAPWLTVDPTATSTHPTPECTENCNSNVIFLPGLQASRLYKPNDHFGTDRLWEPNGNADVRDLYLDADGKSVRPDIYATEVIDEIFGLTPDIYKTFVEMMDQLKSDQKINDWSPIPYDWRLTVDDILDNGTKIENGYSYHTASATPYVFQELERLAKTSRTGRVTIIAHSNGGLVAKALMVRLEQMGKAGLVDRVILLASPQLGTPKAIASLLHGEDQEYLGGVIMNKPTARELGRNMPGGYQLLPSKAYFDTVVDSPVMIRNTSSTQSLFQAYSTSTDSAEELYKLLRGDEGRTSAGTDDVESLINLNGALLTQAKDLHALIDGWVAPTSTQVIEIAGWGLDTIRGIRYTDRTIEGCAAGPCRRLTYAPLFTDDGDETVVLPSAMAIASSTRYWVDLFDANRKEDEKWSHKNISEVTQVKELLRNIFLNGTDVLPQHISTSPSPTLITKKMRYTLHSPLSLGVYDSRGRYTGLSSSTIPGVEYPIVREEIPNSYYMEFGETKIVGFEEGSSTISMMGQARGVFTLEGEKIEGGVIVASTTFPDIPVATGTIVTLLQPVGVLSPTISVDFDGNGTTDVQIGQEGFSETDSVALLHIMVGTLGLGTKQEKRLLTIVDRLDHVIKKEFKKPERKVARLSKVLERLTEVVTKLSQKGKIANDDKNELLKLIVAVRQQVIQ